MVQQTFGFELELGSGHSGETGVPEDNELLLLEMEPMPTVAETVESLDAAAGVPEPGRPRCSWQNPAKFLSRSHGSRSRSTRFCVDRTVVAEMSFHRKAVARLTRPAMVEGRILRRWNRGGRSRSGRSGGGRSPRHPQQRRNR